MYRLLLIFCVSISVVMTTGCGGNSSSASPAPTSATARLSATESPERVIVRDESGASVMMQRRPFALQIIDDQGRAVFRQVAQASGLPLLLSLAEPPPLGSDFPRMPTPYAPFSYSVGAAIFPQIPAGPWQSNILLGLQAGVSYHATALREWQIEGDRLTAVLETNDPSGRQMHLTMSRRDKEWRVVAEPVPATGVIAMADSIVSEPEQPFYGFGGRHNAVNQRGEDFLGWIQQQNLGVGQLSPLIDRVPFAGPKYMFPNGKSAAYYISPSFTTHDYSFLINQPELTRWRMASDRSDAWQVSVSAPRIDYSVFVGEPKASIAQLTTITGRHRAPPEWTLGVIIDRATVPFNPTAPDYLAVIEDDLAQIDALGIRLSGYRIEGWFELAPAVRQRLKNELQARGIKVLAYFRPFTAIDTAGTEDASTFTESIQQNYVTKNALGLPYIFPGNFFGLSALIDFTQPAAVMWWKGRIKALLDEGVDGFMQDFGEQVMQDMVFADGRRGDVMHHEYPTLYHRITREAVDEWRASNGQAEDVWFFTRTGYSGRDGSPHYESANFAGDGNTDFSASSGLASQAPDMLSRGISGATGFTTDIGGYFDFVSPKTTKELFIRWAQWAVFSPYMRVHGSVNNGTHMPWYYDEETLTEWLRLTDLRYRLQPYLAKVFATAAETGLPVARPLWLMFPNDPEVRDADQEWMLGDDILVAPVVSDGARERRVYLPQGCWQWGETGERMTGGRHLTVSAPLTTLPYFIRCGATPFQASGD